MKNCPAARHQPSNESIMSTPAKDLTKEAPRSPRTNVGGYVILGRTLDKGRADVAGTIGDYHFDCPLDNMLFGFKGVKGPDVKKLLETGQSDQDVAAWIDAHGEKKSPEEIKAWNTQMESNRPYDNPEKKEWFAGVCEEAGIDPAKSTLFDYLDADDKITFKK
jgi:hypothetical protein